MDFCKRNAIKQAKHKCLHDWTQTDSLVHEAYLRHAHQDKFDFSCSTDGHGENIAEKIPNVFGYLQRIMPLCGIKSLD